MKTILAVVVALTAAPAFASRGFSPDRSALRTGAIVNGTASLVHKQAPTTFKANYEAHTGRGIWKWDPYMGVYQRHLALYANQPVKILEIGVQSGGSIEMFQQVLGSQCSYFGMDINQNCLNFANPTTVIYMGDQSSVPAWTDFFAKITPSLDITIDDGGHQAHQMLTTFQQVLPHLNPGGSLATEDVHGQNDDYLSKFLHPAADYIGQQQGAGAVFAGVHIYPFMLLVQKAGGNEAQVQSSVAPASVTVDSVQGLLAALPQNLGKTVALANPTWPTFIAPDGLKVIMSTFYELYGGPVGERPAGCHTNDQESADCTMFVTNTNLQNLVTGVHIFPTQVLVEVAASPPSIFATRKGSEWIVYNGPA